MEGGEERKENAIAYSLRNSFDPLLPPPPDPFQKHDLFSRSLFFFSPFFPVLLSLRLAGSKTSALRRYLVTCVD